MDTESFVIHAEWKVNEGRAVNKQRRVLLYYREAKEQESKIPVAEELGISKDTDIYGMDLFLYNRMGAQSDGK